MAPDTSEPLSIAEVSQLVRPALVHVTSMPSDGFTYIGTGFMVRSDGLMVTNRHIVERRRDGDRANGNPPKGSFWSSLGAVFGPGHSDGSGGGTVEVPIVPSARCLWVIPTT